MKGAGAPQGIDDKATLAWYRKGPPPRQLGLLRGVLAGSVRLQKRLYDAQMKESPVCPFCWQADETLQHCFWDCPHWDHILSEHRLPANVIRESWPACTKECGIFIEDERVMHVSQMLAHEENWLDAFCIANYGTRVH